LPPRRQRASFAANSVTHSISSPSTSGILRRLFIIAAGLAFFAGTAPAQEALRQSLAGEAAAAAGKQAASTIGYYNLMLGPVAWRFSSGLSSEYNDNVNLRPSNPDGDFIFQPSLDAEMTWPLTQNNSLNFDLGLGYMFYLQHQELDQLYINPGSGLSFDIYIKDLKINLHDRLSVTENGYENPGFTNSNSIVRMENDVGASGLLDLNDAVVNLGYDHVNYISLAGTQLPDSSSENVSADAGFRVRPEFLAGIEAGGGLFHYAQSTTSSLPDATQWNLGLFLQAQISEYFSTEFHAGYTVYSPQSSATFTNASATTGLYFDLSATHILNRFLTYTLSAGRSTDVANYGVPDEYYFVRFEPDWNLFKKLQMGTPLSWEQGTQLGANGSGTSFNQVSAGINFSRTLIHKSSGANLSCSLSEQFVHETSNQPSGTYTVNIVGLNFTYQF
jgi:hypothetical protein